MSELMIRPVIFAVASTIFLAACPARVSAPSDAALRAADAASADAAKPTVTAENLHADCTKTRTCLAGQTCSLWHDFAGQGHWTCEIVCDLRLRAENTCPPPLRCGYVADGPGASCIDFGDVLAIMGGRDAAVAAPAPDAATASPASTPGEGCGGDDYEKRVLAQNGWVQRMDDAGSCCIAAPSVRGDGCSVDISTKKAHPPGAGGVAPPLVRWTEKLACGEEKTICGRAFRCECQKCSNAPSYADRMKRGRRLIVEKKTRTGLIARVEYEGGTCDFIGGGGGGGGIDQQNRPFWICYVEWGDESTVGGCMRGAGGDQRLKCGEMFNACDGVILRCDCPDGGGSVVSLQR